MKLMSLREAVDKDIAERWIAEGHARADVRAPELSKLLSDDQIGALYGNSTNDVYKAYNQAMREGTATPGIKAFALEEVL